MIIDRLFPNYTYSINNSDNQPLKPMRIDTNYLI